MLKIFEYPWQSISLIAEVANRAHLPKNLRPGNGAVALRRATTQLNFGSTSVLHQRYVEVAGQRWILCELPGPRVKGAEKSALTLQAQDTSGQSLLMDLPYINAHEQFDASDNSDSDSESKNISAYEVFIDEILGVAQEVVDFLYRENRGVKKTETNVKYWADLYDQLMSSEDEDKARQSLITDLAEESPPHMQGIRNSPKKRLLRIRCNQRIHRIQELDNQCIIDYAQRPGVTMAQKAGQRQRLLSVARIESFDTLENRVMLDFCRLARKAALRYDRDNLHNKSSPRLTRVHDFGRLCKDVSRDDVFVDVRRLTLPCRRPNHVLLENARYSKIWKSYQLLITDFDVRDEVWRWPRRAWADITKIFVSFSAIELERMKQFPILERPYFKPIKYAREQFAGRWFRDDPFPGPFILGKDESCNVSLYIVDGEQIDSFIDYSISICSADFYYVWVSNKSDVVSIIPVWATLGDSRWSGLRDQPVLVEGIKADLSNYLERLDATLDTTKAINPTKRTVKVRCGLMIHGNWGAQKEDNLESAFPKSDGMKIPIWYMDINLDRNRWKTSLKQLAQSLGDLLSDDL